MSKQKKPNKQLRYKLREANANVFKEGFTLGYDIGYQLGLQEGIKQQIHPPDSYRKEITK